MADLTGKEASQSVKITGADPTTGSETNYLDVDSSGRPTIKVNDGSGNSVSSTNVGGKQALDVNIVNTSNGGDVSTGIPDESAFVEGTTPVVPIAGVYNETIASDPTEDQAAAPRITAKRALHVHLRDNSGTILGTNANPIDIRDKFQSGYVSGNLSVGTSAVEAKVGGSRVSTRKMLYIENTGTTDIFYGPSGVTSSGSAVGAILRRRQFVFLPAGDIAIYVISSAVSGSVTIQEMS